MIFEVENLGNINKASIDLSKDLIILCGKNNTGKTYLAYSIYGLFKYSIKHEFILKIIPTLNLDSILNELFNKKKIEIDLYTLFIQNYKKIFKNISELYLEQLGNVWGTDKSFILKTKFSIHPKDIKKDELKNYFFQYSEQHRRGSPEISYELIKRENSDKLIIEITHIDNSKSGNRKLIIDLLERFVISMLWRYFFIKKTFMFPAERIAFNIFSKELSVNRFKFADEISSLENAEDIYSLAKRRVSRYPMPIRDLLEISEDLKNFEKNKSEYSFLADEIEELLLKGKLSISDEETQKIQTVGDAVEYIEKHYSPN